MTIVLCNPFPRRLAAAGETIAACTTAAFITSRRACVPIGAKKRPEVPLVPSLRQFEASFGSAKLAEG